VRTRIPWSLARMYEMGGRKGWQKDRPVEREVTIADLAAEFLLTLFKLIFFFADSNSSFTRKGSRLYSGT